MSIDGTRVDLGYLLIPYLTHILPLLIPKLTFRIGLYNTLYWLNLGNLLNMTENLLTVTNNINSNKHTFKIV